MKTARQSLYALLKRDAEHTEFSNKRRREDYEKRKKITKAEHDLEVSLD